MLITRTPLRISIGGGGTDLPSYFTRFGGFVISAAISHFIFISLNRIFGDGYSIKYSEQERTASVDQIHHPIFREALRRHEVEPGVELASLADVPAGTGLGSSGAFTVGLLNALHAFRRDRPSPGELAEEACRIEIESLGRSVGKQDQYIAAYGGITCFDFRADGSVEASPLRAPDHTLQDLESRLLMFFTGFSRGAGDVLEDQRRRSEASDSSMLDNLHHVKQLGLRTKEALEAGNLDGYAAVMREHWEYKRARSRGVSSEAIDRWYSKGMENGAVAGKLVGAGGGGFLLFLAEDQARLRKAMSSEGLRELPFRFDHEGSTVIFREW